MMLHVRGKVLMMRKRSGKHGIIRMRLRIVPGDFFRTRPQFVSVRNNFHINITRKTFLHCEPETVFERKFPT